MHIICGSICQWLMSGDVAWWNRWNSECSFILLAVLNLFKGNLFRSTKFQVSMNFLWISFVKAYLQKRRISLKSMIFLSCVTLDFNIIHFLPLLYLGLRGIWRCSWLWECPESPRWQGVWRQTSAGYFLSTPRFQIPRTSLMLRGTEADIYSH